jgi:hypothetical protein
MFRGQFKMPWVKISSDAHKDMKQFLVDIDGLSLGELVESAFEYCMENLEPFEKFLELEESEDAEQDKQDEEDETDKEDD